MKCLGVHLGSTVISTHPATPAKQRYAETKTLTTIGPLQAEIKLFHHSNKGLESHSKCGIKHLQTLVPFTPSAFGGPVRSPFHHSVFDGLTCFRAEDNNNSYIYSW